MLRAELAAGDTNAVDRLWSELERQGTPLVESTPTAKRCASSLSCVEAQLHAPPAAA